MAVTWTDTATRSRAQLTRDLARTNPSAARKQSMAIRKLAKTLDGTATYQRLPNGARFVPAPRYPVVVLYDRDPGTGDAVILDLAPARSNWRPQEPAE